MPPLPTESLDPRLAAARGEAERLIKNKPWLERIDWAAGRIVHDPHSGAFLMYIGIGACLLIGGSSVFVGIAYREGGWFALTAGSLTAAAALIFFRIKARHGRSECLLRSIPARIGGMLEADVRVRLRGGPDARVRASLANVWPTGRGGARTEWSAEQSIGRDEIRVAPDGTWTIPVRISIPHAVRARDLGPNWLLEVRAETAGPDYLAQFGVPVFDLADLQYDENPAERQRAAAYATPFRGFEVAVGTLVGAFIGVGLGFASALSEKALRGFFLMSLVTGFIAFTLLGAWRNAAAVALRDRGLPERSREVLLRLTLLRIAPWTLAAIVLWFSWRFLPLAGLAWGLGMLLCGRPSPFGRIWRDPVFQSGAALTLSTLVVAPQLIGAITRLLRAVIGI